MGPEMEMAQKCPPLGGGKSHFGKGEGVEKVQTQSAPRRTDEREGRPFVGGKGGRCMNRKKKKKLLM